MPSTSLPLVLVSLASAVETREGEILTAFAPWLLPGALDFVCPAVVTSVRGSLTVYWTW